MLRTWKLWMACVQNFHTVFFLLSHLLSRLLVCFCRIFSFWWANLCYEGNYYWNIKLNVKHLNWKDGERVQRTCINLVANEKSSLLTLSDAVWILDIWWLSGECENFFKQRSKMKKIEFHVDFQSFLYPQKFSTKIKKLSESTLEVGEGKKKTFKHFRQKKK